MANFFANEGENYDEAEVLLQQLLKEDPSNPSLALKYAKLLKKMGRYPLAEVMYKAAIQNSFVLDSSNSHNSSNNTFLQGAILCNYGAFLYKQLKNKIKALFIFEFGLKHENLQSHRGLLKNYNYLLKAQPELRFSADPVILSFISRNKSNLQRLLLK